MIKQKKIIIDNLMKKALLSPEKIIEKINFEKDILNKAKKGDKLILKIEGLAFIKDVTHDNTPLHYLAQKKIIQILKHPMVAKVKNQFGETPLHWLAEAGIKQILKHKQVGRVQDSFGDTPLHKLADQGVKEVLKHKDIVEIKNINGECPLHVLAWKGIKEVLKHKSADKIKNKKGMTPKDILECQEVRLKKGKIMLSDKILKIADIINLSRLKEKDKVIVDLNIVKKYDNSIDYIKLVQNIIRWANGKPVIAGIQGKFAIIAADIKDALLGTTAKIPLKALKKI